MTLNEHPQFEELIAITSDQLRIVPELVRKDYWVTRVLRAVGSDDTLRTQVIFKGGTSLSKGWQVIDRFSEDLDLLTTGPNFSAPPGKRAKAALFKRILECVEKETPLQRPNTENLTQEERDFLYFRAESNCSVRFPLPGRRISSKSDSMEWILLEMGFRGGANPTAMVPLNSFVGETARARAFENSADLHNYELDFLPFEFVLLHPTRTFVEKLLATHCDICKGIEHVRTRHYYDVFALYRKHSEVAPFLDGDDFHALLRDAIEIGNANFNTDVNCNLDMATSPALNLTPEQIIRLAAQYQAEQRYYFKGQPAFGDIVDTIAEIRDRLQRARREKR